jgi:hypothetical protein
VRACMAHALPDDEPVGLVAAVLGGLPWLLPPTTKGECLVERPSRRHLLVLCQREDALGVQSGLAGGVSCSFEEHTCAVACHAL